MLIGGFMRDSLFLFILNIGLFILLNFCFVWAMFKTAEKMRDFKNWHNWGIAAAIIGGITASHLLIMLMQ